MQITRLVEMIYILMRKKSVTAGTLAGHFGVSTRTVYRDVDVLSLSGIPVYTERGKGGGISMMPGFVLDKSLLNEREQQDVLSALQGLAGVRAAETDKVLTKLSALFNKNMVNWLEVDFSDWSYGNGDVFELLKTAILERRIAEFDYYSSYGETTHRRVEPVQLWFKHRSWYLKAFCLTRMELRLFKLSRLREPALTGENFPERKMFPVTHPSDMSKQLYLPPSGDGSAQNSQPNADPVPDDFVPRSGREVLDVTLTLKIAPSMAFRVYDEFSAYECTRDENGFFIVNVTWPDDDWVYGTILSFGEHIEVLEPERIRKIIRGKADKILKQYANMT